MQGWRRTFDESDQDRFARASGDFNPLHMDERVAAITQAGARVVHGVHALLWALDMLAGGPLSGRPIREVRVRFNRFIYLKTPLSLQIHDQTEDAVIASAAAGDAAAMALTIYQGSPSDARSNLSSDVPDTWLGPEPSDPDEEQMDGASGWLSPPNGSDMLPASFPALSSLIAPQRVISIALMSSLVGMVCPGRNSIFSSLAIELQDRDKGRPGFSWQARRPDPRYNRVDLVAEGSGLRQTARALIRPTPVAAPSIAEATAKVCANEFADRRALIIGGSRGLGAATATLLSVGGAKVTLTYHSQVEAASTLAAEIQDQCGADAVEVIQHDVRCMDNRALDRALQTCTHIYYFPTPKITRQHTAIFDSNAFRDFCSVYVDGFSALCTRAVECSSRTRLGVLYPSSTAVSERPRGMTEYAMAKAAGEVLCAELMRGHPQLSIVAPRFPRVLTDQTALAIPVRSISAIDAMLPCLRSENATR